MLFCGNLFLGLIFSQLVPEWLAPPQYNAWKQVVKIVTMFHLSYIMINVGFEFELDKSRLGSYAKDYLIAMTAATFPWIFVSTYFMYALGDDFNMPWKWALVAGRFAAPTSAGILFTMLEAAGMKETWLFQKARVLAIFDDLDTLLLMVPLKAIIVGAKWELSVDLIWVLGCLVIMYVCLHRVNIPATWYCVALYAAILTAFAEVVHHVTHDHTIDVEDLAETVHLEILLPAFTIGCIVKHPHAHLHLPSTAEAAAAPAEAKRSLRRQGTTELIKAGFAKVRDAQQEKVKFYISAIFMVLVGLSMPAVFNPDNALGSGDGGHRRLEAAAPAPKMEAGMLVLHVVVCSLLMNVGKMFPALCYRSEVNLKTRLALAIGMMPRGEVCAAIIVNAIALGVTGDAVTIAVCCLAVNMTCVSGFIFSVKQLSAAGERQSAADALKAKRAGGEGGGQSGELPQVECVSSCIDSVDVQVSAVSES